MSSYYLYMNNNHYNTFFLKYKVGKFFKQFSNFHLPKAGSPKVTLLRMTFKKSWISDLRSKMTENTLVILARSAGIQPFVFNPLPAFVACKCKHNCVLPLGEVEFVSFGSPKATLLRMTENYLFKAALSLASERASAACAR